jgi:hypothetical protein
VSTPSDDDPPSPPPSTDIPSSAEPAPSAIARPFASPPSDIEPILPATLDDDALRDAVGASTKKRSRRDSKAEARLPVPEEVTAEGGARRRRTMVVVVLSLVGGLGIAALVLLGRVNQERYFLTCWTTQAVAQQGRSFPPWGAKPLMGAEWKPIALPANAECKAEEVDDRSALEGKYLELLLERTSASLTGRSFVESSPADAKPGNATLDMIAVQLEQALLLSRSPMRSDQRKQVERMLGDVQYWRAMIRLRDATVGLSDAARQFDAAALQRPLHVSDAGDWATFSRRLSDELIAGPSGATTASQPMSAGAPVAPPGSALPVETEPASPEPAAPATTPDAGIPSGGVLL